jgi:hypothetical protein
MKLTLKLMLMFFLMSCAHAPQGIYREKQSRKIERLFSLASQHADSRSMLTLDLALDGGGHVRMMMTERCSVVIVADQFLLEDRWSGSVSEFSIYSGKTILPFEKPLRAATPMGKNAFANQLGDQALDLFLEFYEGTGPKATTINKFRASQKYFLVHEGLAR